MWMSDTWLLLELEVSTHTGHPHRTECTRKDGLDALLVAERPGNMLAYLRDGSAQTIVHTKKELADETFYLIARV